MGNCIQGWTDQYASGPQPDYSGDRQPETPPLPIGATSIEETNAGDTADEKRRRKARMAQIDKLSLGRVLASDEADEQSAELVAFFETTIRDFSDKTCPICLVDYEHGESIVKSGTRQCKHMFHKECISDWLSSGNDDCPCCRREYILAEMSVRNIGPTGLYGETEFPS